MQTSDSSRHNLFLQLARVSWLSVIVLIVANIAIKAASGKPPSPSMRLISSVLFVSFALAGLVSGIVALSGIRRYGRQGLLGPALIGVCLWTLLVGTTVNNVQRARKIAATNKPTVLRPVKHLAGGTRVQDEQLRFSFDLPEGYEPFALAEKPPGSRHAFTLADTNESMRFFLVSSLAGALKRERLNPNDLPAGSSASVVAFDWRGIQVDGTRVPEKLEESEYLTFNVQIPLRPRAIQLQFVGPLALETETKALAEQVLASLDGETTW